MLVLNLNKCSNEYILLIIYIFLYSSLFFQIVKFKGLCLVFFLLFNFSTVELIHFFSLLFCMPFVWNNLTLFWAVLYLLTYSKSVILDLLTPWPNQIGTYPTQLLQEAASYGKLEASQRQVWNHNNSMNIWCSHRQMDK